MRRKLGLETDYDVACGWRTYNGGSRERGGGSHGDGGGTPIGRRQFLGGLSLAAAGGLAGCPANAESVADSTDVFGHAFPYDPKSVQLNPWPGGSYPYEFFTVLYEPLSLWVPGEGRRLTDLVTDVTRDGSAATVTFNDEFTWWNGEPVTARDQWVYERIQSAVSDEERPPVELEDERTLRYEFDADLAETVALSHVAGDALNTASWLFERWVDRLDQASTESATTDVVEDLQEWRIGLEKGMEEGFGNGPYRLSEVSLNRIMLERFDDHPYAGDIDLPRLWFPVLQTVSREAFIKDGRIDGGLGSLSTLSSSPPSFIEELDEYPTDGGTKLVLHWDHPHLGRKPVREAMAAAIPFDQVVDVGGFGDPTRFQTGLAGPAQRRWLGEDLSGFRTRPVEADTERAAELMRGADYRLDGNDKWRDADGRRVEIRLRSPIWADWKFAADAVNQSLSSFGFKVDFTQIPDTQLVADVRSYNFDVMLWPSDARAYSAFDVSSSFASTIGYGVTDPGAAVSVHGKPATVSLPSADEPVDLYETWQRLRTAPDEETAREAVTTFARFWNEMLPDIQLATQVTTVWGNTRDFDWPEATGSTYRAFGPADRPEYRLLNRGLVGSIGG